MGPSPAGCAGERAATGECQWQCNTGEELRAVWECVEQRGEWDDELQFHGRMARRDELTAATGEILRTGPGPLHFRRHVGG